MNSYEYINEVKQAKGLDSDYKVCKMMNWPTNRVTMYKNGQSMDNEAARQVAEILGVPVWQVIADMESERQKDPAKKKAWKMLSKMQKQAGRVTANSLFLLAFSSISSSLFYILC
jgi:hypothetical protein